MVEGSWHSKPLSAVFSELGTSQSGLGEKKAAERLEKGGRNEIAEVKKETPTIDEFVKEQNYLHNLTLILYQALSNKKPVLAKAETGFS